MTQPMLNILKKYFTASFRSSLRRVHEEFGIQRSHQRSVAKARRLAGPLKLHFGCGLNLKKGWVNIDLYEPGADLALDLREPLPFPDESVEIVYSEHIFEHLTYPDEVFRLLRECYRVLRPNGLFSIGVPDAAPLLCNYALGNREYFKSNWNPRYPEWLAVPMHRINYLFHQFGEHKYAYDEEILLHTLRAAGFESACRREFSPSLDSEWRRDGTLYADAVKQPEGNSSLISGKRAVIVRAQR